MDSDGRVYPTRNRSAEVVKSLTPLAPPAGTTVLGEIKKATKIYVFVHGDYADSLMPAQVEISKTEAKRIAKLTYERHPLRWKWNGNSLLIFPRQMGL